MNRFKEGKFTVYTSADGLANDFVRSLYVDHGGALWIGTRGGLTRMKDGVTSTYTTAQGLSDNFVGTIYEDGARNLWIGTNGGRLNRLAHGQFTAFFD